jgi:CHASE3 domain sensor protein
MQETISLAERLKRQIKHENETIQDLTQQQLSAMRKELNGILRQELNTIKADISAQTSNIGWSMIKNRVLWPIIIGLTFSLGIFGGSWATMQYLSSEIQTMRVTVLQLEKQGGKLTLNDCGGRLCIVEAKNGGTWTRSPDNRRLCIPEGY